MPHAIYKYSPSACGGFNLLTFLFNSINSMNDAEYRQSILQFQFQFILLSFNSTYTNYL